MNNDFLLHNLARKTANIRKRMKYQEILFIILIFFLNR